MQCVLDVQRKETVGIGLRCLTVKENHQEMK